jgi:prohibitin 1
MSQEFDADRKSRLAKSIGRSAAIALGLFCLMLVGCMSMTRIPTGNVGVVALFGRLTGQVLPNGLHFINPLADVNKLSIQTTELKESATVPSSEGLTMTLEVSLLFHLNPAQAADVYRLIGDDYQAKVVEPNFRSSIREATASHPAEALYSSEREKVGMEIEDSLKNALGPRGILVEKVLMRNVELPRSLSESIQLKQQAQQEALTMSFKLQKETQEAQRKRIEAQGIKDFQTIVSQGISPELLQWKGIEATEKLASSSNSKIIVIGGGKSGLPIILNQ